MRTRRHKATKRLKRYTVSLPEDDYLRLKGIAEKHRPELSLQYVTRFAIEQLLARADDPQLELDLRNPLPTTKDRHGTT